MTEGRAEALTAHLRTDQARTVREPHSSLHYHYHLSHSQPSLHSIPSHTSSPSPPALHIHRVSSAQSCPVPPGHHEAAPQWLTRTGIGSPAITRPQIRR